MTGYVILQGSAFELATTILDGSLCQALCLLGICIAFRGACLRD